MKTKETISPYEMAKRGNFVVKTELIRASTTGAAGIKTTDMSGLIRVEEDGLTDVYNARFGAQDTWVNESVAYFWATLNKETSQLVMWLDAPATLEQFRMYFFEAVKS